MPRPSRAGAVVFDFDGVIANSEPLHFRAFQRVLAELGYVLTEEAYYARYLGYADEEAFQAVAADQGRPVDEAALEQLMRRKADAMPALLAEPSVLFPDAKACIERLAAHVPLAIASGALRHEIESVLAMHDLARHFQVIVAAGETPRSKPAPDPYLRAVAGLAARGALPPGDASSVAIEDSHWGLLSARTAGLRTIAVTTSYDASSLDGADQVIARLADISIDDIWTLMQRA